jgi:hypothetical protein
MAAFVKAQAGQYYPRIFRPAATRPPCDEQALSATGVVLNLLADDLQSLFETVEPVVDNLAVYGHRIRQQLILAATEAETAFVAILKANSYAAPGFWTTKDYIKLADPLHLRPYRVRLQHYPAIAPFEPFDGWVDGQPTQSLPWYDAYNRAKHDREANLSVASLTHAIHATAAVYVLAAAQFGSQFFDTPGAFSQQLFALAFDPTVAAEAYQPALGQPWQLTPYPFPP